jgi:hypothetical protein
MENLNLNLDDYNLYELTKLFRIKVKYDKNDLKKALKIVYMAHPDKSKRDKKYFIFLSNAYKRLLDTYKYYKKRDETTKYTEKENYLNEKNRMKINELVKNKNFNNQFNKVFEKLELKKPTRGYEEWYRNKDTGICNLKGNTKDELENELIKLKKKKRENVLTKYNGIKEYNNCSMEVSSIIDNELDETNYDSGMYASLEYQDLKKAYTDTVIPVTYDDYLNKPKYVSNEELSKVRAMEKNGYDYGKGKKIHMENQYNEEKKNIEKSFNLVKQMEDTRRYNNIFNSNFYLLENK